GARRPARRVSDGRRVAGIREALDGRVRPHIPIEVPCPGEIHPDHADGRALGIGAQNRGGADPDREIGGAGNDRLQGLAPAGGAEDVEDDAMLFEDAGALAEPRRIDRPQPKLPDCNLERLLRRRARDGKRDRSREHKRQQPAPIAHGSSQPFVGRAPGRGLWACSYFVRGGIWMSSASCSLLSGASMNLSLTASLWIPAMSFISSVCIAALGWNSLIESAIKSRSSFILSAYIVIALGSAYIQSTASR